MVSISNVPRRLVNLTLGPQLVVLFWGVIEALEGGALVEEVHPWRYAL